MLSIFTINKSNMHFNSILQKKTPQKYKNLAQNIDLQYIPYNQYKYLPIEFKKAQTNNSEMNKIAQFQTISPLKFFWY